MSVAIAAVSQRLMPLSFFDVPPHWRLSPGGAIGTVLASAGLATLAVRDPLGYIILPALMGAFGTLNIALGILPEGAITNQSTNDTQMPIAPSLLLVAMAICCWRNDQGALSRRLRTGVATIAMSLGGLILVFYTIPDITGFRGILTNQATMIGALIMSTLGLALSLLNATTGNPKLHWPSNKSNRHTSLVIKQQGQVTKVDAAPSGYLEFSCDRMVGRNIREIFNEHTVSPEDLGKLYRARNWAQSGKVPVGTVITYHSRTGVPRFLDTLIRPTLVDGQVSGVHILAKEISDYHDVF